MTWHMMKKIDAFIFIVLVLTADMEWLGGATAQAGGESIAQIERLDPRFDRLVPRDAQVEKVADGFAWVEGPVWSKPGGYLLFTDIPNNSVFKWQPGRGVSLFMKPSGYTGAAPFTGREPGANGLAFDSQGRLTLAEHGDRRIARLESDDSKTTLVDRYQGKRINSPNDLVYKSDGSLYYTDPPFGLPQAFDDPQKELPLSGVYRLSPQSELTLLTDRIRKPNGIAFSPDEKTLYVSNAEPTHAVWLAYAVNDDGTIANGRVLFDATEFAKTRKGAPDGMKVDREGNLFAAGPGGIYVIAPEGTLLGRIELGVATANCAWGEDGSVLYIAASTAIYRIRTGTRGANF